MKRFLLSAVCAAIVAGGLAPVAAIAADAPNLGKLEISTSPLPINLEVDPGKTVSTDVRVKQNGSAAARMKVTLMKFGAFGEEGQPQLMDREPGDDYFDWVKFDKTEFDAPPNVWTTVKMTVNVPKYAAFGYYYAVAFSRVGDDVKRGNKTNSIAGSAATLVLMDVNSPNAKRIVNLESFKVGHRFYEYLPSDFTVKLSNTGNVHVVPHGDIFLTKGNKSIGILPINSGLGNMLPASKRIFDVFWDKGFPVYKDTTKKDKKGKTIRKLEWDWSKANTFRMGKYTAKLLAIYDDGKRDVPLEATVSFWVIPWRALLVVLAIVAAMGFVVFMMVRGTMRRAQRLGRNRRK